MYSVIYSKSAVKELKKLDKPTATIIFGWIDKNLNGCENPRMLGKALVGDKRGYWRYRIGAYRLIAAIHGDIYDDIVTIEIISAGHRSGIYNKD